MGWLKPGFGPTPGERAPPPRTTQPVDRYDNAHRNDVHRRRPIDEEPSANEDRLPEVPIDDDLVRRRRIETAVAFLASDAGSPYRDVVDAVRDFGMEQVGPNWFLTPSDAVKGWEGTAPSNPALDLRQQIMNLQLGAADGGNVAAGKAFELTFPPPRKEDVAAMWSSYAAWKSDRSNLANGVALPGDWAVSETNEFQQILFGRPLYALQDFETIRLRINSAFKVDDTSGAVRNCIPSKKAFVEWCLVTHHGSAGKVSSRMIAHVIHSIQPAHQQQIGTFRDAKFQEGRVERFDSTAPMITAKIDALVGGVATIEVVANLFKVLMTDVHVKRLSRVEVMHVDGENVKVHFRINGLQAYWQGASGSYLFFPIEHATNWTASGSWVLKEVGREADEKPVVFAEEANTFDDVDYAVAVPWLRQLINTHALPLGFVARMMAETLVRFQSPWDLSWTRDLSGVRYGTFAV